MPPSRKPEPSTTAKKFTGCHASGHSSLGGCAAVKASKDTKTLGDTSREPNHRLTPLALPTRRAA